MKILWVPLTAAILVLTVQVKAEVAAYMDPDLPLETRVQDLLSRMTLEEKVGQITGVWNEAKQAGCKRLGIPMFRIVHGPYSLSDAYLPQGPRVGTWFPVSIAQAATWDTPLVERIHTVTGKEIHAVGGQIVAGPAMNIIRDPRAGRSFEYFTEDPYLNSQIAAAYTRGLQSRKVMANLKHYACNNQEWNRFGMNVVVSERALREIYLPGYKAAIQDGGAWSVMGAYNKINGIYACEQPFTLTEVLRKEWGFKGFVLSDWGGTKSTVDSVKAGLDMEMPSERWYGKKLIEAVHAGDVTEQEVDRMAGNLLRGLLWTGQFTENPKLDDSVLRCPEHLALARQAAAKSMVLLKNDGNVLPFDLSKIRKIAVIGPNGEYGIHYNNGQFKAQLLQGAGSAQVNAERKNIVTPLQGIRNKAGDNVEVAYAPGCYAESGCGQIPSKYLLTPDGTKQGLLAKYFDNVDLKGEPVKTEIAETLFYSWKSELPIPEAGRERDDQKRFSVEWTGTLTAPETRKYMFEVRNESGRAKLYIDGKRIACNPSGNRTDWNNTGAVILKAGQTYDIRVEYANSGDLADFRLGWDYENEAWLKEAVNLARQSDAVILTVGLTGDMGETEAGDRRTLDLAKSQERLINEIAKANKNTVVVLIAGSAITMDAWLDNVSSVLMAWYPGQEGGNALADVILGDVNPAGRLPITFPKSLKQYPGDYYVRGHRIVYKEGIYVGYRYFDRHGIKPLFPFGYGLSYTTFEYNNPKIDASAYEADGTVAVTVNVKNTGRRNGEEVVQVYVRDVKSSVDRPVKEMKGFQRIALKSGETKTVNFILKQDAFAFWSDAKKKWTVEPGEFEILFCASSADIREKASCRLK